MKNYWFKAKRYGWGWYPITWQGWLVVLIWVGIAVWDFLRIDAQSHSGSDTLVLYVPQLIILLFFLTLICWKKGEKPSWHWGGEELPMPKSMKWTFGFFIFLLVVTFALDAATFYFSHQIRYENGAVSNSSLSVFSSPTYGFSIHYPNTFFATTTFATSYLLPNSWNIDAPEGTGEEILDLQYPASNNILSAEVRVGASKEPSQITACMTVPENQGLASETANIHGATFAVFTGNDAATSHFAVRKSYRIVRNQTCYAIDEIVYGTNPEVYSPPAKVPFEQATAQSALDEIVQTFIFK